MTALIRLRPAQNLENGLAPGEYALDEAAGRLYFDRGDSHEPESVSLDVIPLTEAPESPESGSVVAFSAGGAQDSAFTLGGGGVAPDDQPWRAPGCVPVGFTTASASLRLDSTIEIAHEAQITRLRVAPAAGVDVLMTFGIENEDGSPVAEFTDSAYAGVLVQTVDILLQPGRYVLFVEAESPLTFDVLRAQRAWSDEIENHPVLVSYA